MTTLSGIALFATVVSLLFTALWFPRSREAARLLVVALLRCVRYTWGWCFVAMLYPPIMLFNWVCPPVEYKPLPPPAVSVNRRTASLPQYSDAELQIPPFSGQAGLTDGAELTISPLYVLVDEPGDEPVKSSTSVESSDRMSRVCSLYSYFARKTQKLTYGKGEDRLRQSRSAALLCRGVADPALPRADPSDQHGAHRLDRQGGGGRARQPADLAQADGQ